MTEPFGKYEPTFSSKAFAKYAFADDGIIPNGTNKPTYEVTFS